MRHYIIITSFLVFNIQGGLRADSFAMGGLGDSISAGTFANRSLMDETSRADSSTEVNYKGWIPLLGNVENKETYSWVSGQKISSQFSKLQEYLKEQGDKLTVLNKAVPGARAIDLNHQVDELIASVKSGKFESLKYVTLMIGANDACGGTPVSEMETQVKIVFAKLAKLSQEEQIKIVVSSIPRIPDLGAPEIANLKTVGGRTCARIRDEVLKECVHMMDWQTPEEYAALVSEVVERNKMLENVTQLMNAEYSNLDVYFSTDFYEAELSPSLLARDCFHPDASGQTEISERIWKAIPWFK